MILVKLFIGALTFVALQDELIKQSIKGSDREGVIKIGMLMVFEMWLLGG